MIWKKPYLRVMIQIFLVVTMSIAFSFIVHEADKTMVSAQTENLVGTCLETNQGEICQEFSSNTCDANCKTLCIPNSRDNVAECELGTCFNPIEGDCLINSPKKTCEDFVGQWNNDELGNIPECQPGCCLTGEQAYFITEQKCRRIQETSGVLTEFKPEVGDEASCWTLARTRTEGACIIGTGEGACRFVTETKCNQLQGEFYESFLCSHPDFESGCEKQKTTSCIEGKDEIYWIDSCGNRENIYEGSSESQKEHSWNNGKILLKKDTCQLTSSNKDTCGNCDIIISSTKCGEKTFGERLSDDSQEVVCRDASCTDSDGNVRDHGESWCFYQGAVEPDEGDRNFLRSVSVPGSRHFRMWCYGGEIYNVSCGERRDGICEESQFEKQDGDMLSVANCRTNTADLCIQYNGNKEEGMQRCNENPDCYVKRIDVDDANLDFKFCVPKYPKGFNMEDMPDYGKEICSIASLTCKAAKVEKVGKDKWINKGCLTESFTKQMNDFCMSLGDCGASVNYIGEFSDSGYRIKKAPELSSGYIRSISNYFQRDSDERIGIIAIETMLGSLGFKGEEGTVPSDFPEDITQEKGFQAFTSIGGIGGPLIYGGAKLGVSAGAAWAPFVGALAGAVVGSAMVGFLISKLEIGAGLSPALTYALIGLGAVGGAMVGYALIAKAGFAASGGPAGLIILAVVVITVLIMKWAGIGKAKEYKARFTCLPWQPEKGGENCGECYNDGLGCSKYSCEALGTACEFINEGSKFEECKSIPNDNTAPQINPLYGVLPEKFNYENVSSNGFKVTAPTEDGCIPAFTQAVMGLQLNEPGRCTFALGAGTYNENDVLEFLNESEFNPEDFGLPEGYLGLVGEDDSLQDYDENEDFQVDEGMDEFYFGGNNLFLVNHTHPLFMPSLSSLGIGGFDPNRRVDFELNVRCEDRNGNKNPTNFVIKMCLSPEKDIFPPIVLSYDPIDNLTKHDATIQNISLYTNEPAECKWSSTDKDYNLMENTMTCENNPDDMHPRGFMCTTNLPINSENATYYSRCLDQPWFKGTVNESDRHVMEHSYAISLIRSKPLVIESLTPKDEDVLTFGTEPASVEIKIETSGGGYNGNAECFYLINDRWIALKNTFAKKHSQTFNQMTSGEKILRVMCKDIISNTANKSSEFEIKIDNKPPEIVRAFYELDKLKVITNEPAVCYYNNYRCNFDIENATSMNIGLSTSHFAEWNPGKTYYIKCTDTWKNWRSECSKVIRPGEF